MVEPTAAEQMIGRDAELAAVIDSAMAASGPRRTGAARRGTTLLVVGDPGLGKSLLLDHVRRELLDRGLTVLSTGGTHDEARLPFAGLHRLLMPLLAEAGRLPDRLRVALDAALGRSEGPSDLFLLALAALELVAEAASKKGAAVVVDDLQFVDSATLDVLTFIGRRIADEPVVMISTVRSGRAWPAELAGEIVTLPALSPEQALHLLAAVRPDLPADVRDFVLRAAGGNPLALRELSRIQDARAWSVEPVLPLTSRLERAFAERFERLPASTRLLLVCAAAGGLDEIDDVLGAASILAPDRTNPADLTPAVDAGLIQLRGPRLFFRHPLMRSAVYQSSPASQRRAVHDVLASQATDPDLRAWQAAAATVGRDEPVARELEQVALRARRRGVPVAAMQAAWRAGELSPQVPDRVDRLLLATELAVEVGRPTAVAQLRAQVSELPMTGAQQGRSIWIGELLEERIEFTDSAVFRLVEAAAVCRDAGDLDMALRLLHGAALRCWWGLDSRAAAEAVAVAADGLPIPSAHPSRLFIRAAVQPVEHGREVLSQLELLAGSVVGATRDPVQDNILGLSGTLLGDWRLSEFFLSRAAATYRSRSQLGRLAQALNSQAAAALFRGHFASALQSADEAILLSADLVGPRWHVAAVMSRMAATACLGSDEPSAEFESDLRRLANPAQWAQWAHTRALVALSSHRHAQAYQALRPMFQPGHRSYHATFCTWVLPDLVEAAMAVGEATELRSAVERLAGSGLASPLLAVGLAMARAVLDPRDEAFADAGERAADYPFVRARVSLAHGSWLRRRSPAVARGPLAEALAGFESVGARGWEDTARAELAAAGVHLPAQEPARSTQPTAQELRIGQLAARGMTNREIGQLLFLSHRTVGSHLYRLFPKLGIVRRSQLRDVLDPA